MILTLFYYLKYRKIAKYGKKETENYQISEIKKLLDYAYKNFECYRRLYDDCGITPSDFNKLSDLDKFPVIKKNDLKTEISKIRSKKNKYNWLKTTGSTGSPFEFPVDSRSKSMRRAAHLISYGFFGKKIYRKTGIFWRDVRKNNFDVIKEFFLRRYWFSIYDTKSKKNILSDEDFIRYNKRILNSKIAQIDGYVSAIVRYVKIIKKYKLKIPKLDHVSVGGEVLSLNSKKLIESILKCRVFNRYGGSEISLIAHEDNIEKNKLKIMNFRLYLESKNKKLIVTDFTNRAIPFIRYELGDLAEKNNWKYIEYVEGRSNLEFKISNKEYLNSHFFHKIFRNFSDIHNFVVIQKKSKEFKIVIDCDNFNETKRSLLVKLNKQLPKLKFKITDEVVSESNLGKHKHFIPLE